jgi:hypothetical protein
LLARDLEVMTELGGDGLSCRRGAGLLGRVAFGSIWPNDGPPDVGGVARAPRLDGAEDNGVPDLPVD